MPWFFLSFDLTALASLRVWCIGCTTCFHLVSTSSILVARSIWDVFKRAEKSVGSCKNSFAAKPDRVSARPLYRFDSDRPSCLCLFVFSRRSRIVAMPPGSNLAGSADVGYLINDLHSARWLITRV